MPNTKLAVYEYGAITRSYVVPNGVVRTDCVWNDCIDALNALGVDFRPVQWPNAAVRRPNAWSNPGNNIGANAASTAYGPAVLGSPHVHGGIGPQHRAAIGCTTNNQPPLGNIYPFMKIYIGQFS
ncbi:hypothetical protein [Stenotrophomonas sp. SY1]|uniref:hypothetical protein n=1 Tax=Stenotrophomonas sp. SY1 TaxID=477235 RepID=UPI001E3AEC98|nr:hypothetical protein [Stenotrophomonas sp. SY1]MCD9087847.1 hypothetical protein [Stenotrophomonas sp. SY1]